MFEGNRFFPLTGMPIWKMARSSTVLAVWLPEPLTVATWMLKSLVMGFTKASETERTGEFAGEARPAPKQGQARGVKTRQGFRGAIPVRDLQPSPRGAPRGGRPQHVHHAAGAGGQRDVVQRVAEVGEQARHRRVAERQRLEVQVDHHPRAAGAAVELRAVDPRRVDRRGHIREW